jgi:iron complex outermembrane receptor protein
MLRKLLPVLLAGTVCAQDLPTYELTEFTVVAPSLRMQTSVVQADAMRSAKPMDLAAILSAKLPAAALSRKGPLAGDLLLRGMSRDNVLITVDNNKTFCACPNRMDPPAFHVSSQQIGSVEIRTGPFSVDEGGTIGGRVAVETKSPSGEDELGGYAYTGSFDYLAGGFSGSQSLWQDTRFSLGIHHQSGAPFEDGDGVCFTDLPGTNYRVDYRDKDAFKVTTFEGKIHHPLGSRTDLTFRYGYQDASDVLYPGLRMDAPKDEMQRASIKVRHTADTVWADHWELGISLSRVDHVMDDALRETINNPPPPNPASGMFVPRGYFMKTEAQSAYAGAYFKAFKSYGESSALRYGVDLQRRAWDADNIIGNLRNDMLPDTLIDQFGIWAVHEQVRGPWAFELGARIDFSRSRAREDLGHIRTIRGITTNRQDDLLPSVYGMISLDATEGLNLYSGIGYGSRSPDPQERYMNLDRPMGSDWVGNPDLDPVGNLEWQSGFRWQGESFVPKGSAFLAWLDDLVYLEKLTGLNATSYANIDARLYGFSIDAERALSDAFSVNADSRLATGGET